MFFRAPIRHDGHFILLCGADPMVAEFLQARYQEWNRGRRDGEFTTPESDDLGLTHSFRFGAITDFHVEVQA